LRKRFIEIFFGRQYQQVTYEEALKQQAQ